MDSHCMFSANGHHAKSGHFIENKMQAPAFREAKQHWDIKLDTDTAKLKARTAFHLCYTLATTEPYNHNRFLQ